MTTAREREALRRKQRARWRAFPRQETHRQNRHADATEVRAEAAQLKEQLELAEAKGHGPQALQLAPAERWGGGSNMQWL